MQLKPVVGSVDQLDLTYIERFRLLKKPAFIDLTSQRI